MQNVNKTLYSLLFVMCCLTSCNGQTKSNINANSQPNSKLISIGQPKIVKIQGSSESDNIHCSLQDRLGNLWFGTTGQGVYRYDGKLFYNYTVKEGLSSNSVWSILEDKAGNIWFGTGDGICRYDGKKIIQISTPFSTRPFVSSNYYSNQSTKNTVWSMLQDKSGAIWFGTGDGVYCYNGVTFTRFLNNDGVVNKEGLHLKMVDCIKEDKKGNLWFSGRAKGNFIFDGKIFTKFTEKTGIGNPLLVDTSGNVWFGGEERQSTVENEGGVWRYDGKTFKNFNTNDGISKYAVWSMLQDKKGNIWIGTRNTGLYKFDGKKFTNYSE